jgi:hypothetical protein
MTPVRDWRIELIEAHPRLFVPLAGNLDRATGYPTCEEGWRDLLERMCDRMETALREEETIRIVQIKEKFAGLRCYWRGNVSTATTVRIMEAIALAEARSACTCEQCGAEGRLYKWGGFYMTRCAAHAVGAEVPERDSEIVHVVRVATADGYRHVRRRYDRETDSFTEVPPASTDQEE